MPTAAYIDPQKLVITVHQAHQHDGEETFVVEVQVVTVPRTSADYMFPIKRGACMVHVPSASKCLRNSPSFCCGGMTLDALVIVLIDEGLEHFTNTHRHGIARDSKVKLHAGVPVPGGQVAHCHSQLQA